MFFISFDTWLYSNFHRGSVIGPRVQEWNFNFNHIQITFKTYVVITKIKNWRQLLDNFKARFVNARKSARCSFCSSTWGFEAWQWSIIADANGLNYYFDFITQRRAEHQGSFLLGKKTFKDTIGDQNNIHSNIAPCFDTYRWFYFFFNDTSTQERVYLHAHSRVDTVEQEYTWLDALVYHVWTSSRGTYVARHAQTN